MHGIKILIIFSVRTLYLAIMTRCVWFNKLVLYPTLFEASLKQCESGFLRTAQSLGKFLTVIGLNALNGKFECLEHMLKKNSRRITCCAPQMLQDICILNIRRWRCTDRIFSPLPLHLPQYKTQEQT